MEPRNLNPVELWKQTDKKNPKTDFCFLGKEKAEQTLAKEAAVAAKNAKEAAHMALPLFTAAGIEIMGQKGDYNMSALGFPLAVGGVVIDTVKAPFCLVIATEEAIRAGIIKLTSLIFEKPPIQQEESRIFKSFLLRMRETATLLVALELEAPDVLDQKLKSGDIEDLVGLTLLHTAYASRRYHSGLLLASQKTLIRDDCPLQGRPLFDKITRLKDSINTALKSANNNLTRLSQEERELEESRIVCNWIRLIKNGKPLTMEETVDTSAAQLHLVNDIILQIENLKPSAMILLPEEPAEIVRHMPK